MDTLAETAGLCTLCHGTNVDTMDYYAGSKLWLAGMTNGHSNSSLGGTGANTRDLFTGNRDVSRCGMGMQMCCGDGCGNGNYPIHPRRATPSSARPPVAAAVIANSGWYGTDYANWYGTGTIGGADGAGTMAHEFTCSKCHSPHATGLPALLIQNCIDTGLEQLSAVSGANLAANNCHRKTSTTDGWHILAPGQ